MPGENPQQAALIAQTNLQTALQQYVMVSQKIQQDQTALIAELSKRFFKKPSFFRSGSWNDNVNSYPFVANSNWGNAITQNGATTTFVIDLQDAEEVNVVAQFYNALGQGVLVAYALSPSEYLTSIPSDQFQLLTLRSCTNASVAGISASLFFSADVPITGNIDPVSGDVAEVLELATSGTEINGLNINGSNPYTAVFQDRIPCAGNRFLHLTGFIQNSDLFTILTSTPTNNFLSYGLIK